MKTKLEVLDHGYVHLVDHWGDDKSIIRAARMSTGNGFRGWGTDEKPGDEKLLRYLWEHKHLTPFEMAGAQFEVQAPIFVFRQWHRHRTQSYNEMSGRYTKLLNDGERQLTYIPSDERLRNSKQDKKNRQGSAAGFDDADVQRASLLMAGAAGTAEGTYRALLDLGVSREVARMVLPVSQYSRMRAQANLRNWLHFLSLRLDAAAQYEIVVYAEAVAKLIAALFPRTWGLFYRDIKEKNHEGR